MTGSTKILTVSYGTFSCTLEGFDDPFATMRGIAEYFRDLAADDRYFGAEPPTPDVEMLQRIAEKEVQRRVEARMGETGVALTQIEDATDEAPAPAKPTSAQTPKPETRRPAPLPEDEDLDHGPLTHDDEYLLSDEPEDVLAVDPDAPLPADGPAETVAEKLRRIRAVVSRSIEPQADGDARSFSERQATPAADTDAEPGRQRALTETIRQITADLDEEEDLPDEEAPAANVFDEPDEAEDMDFGADIDVSDEDEMGAEAGPDDAQDLDRPAARFEDTAPPTEEVAEAPAEPDGDDGWEFEDDDLAEPSASAEDQAEEDDNADVAERVVAKALEDSEGPDDGLAQESEDATEAQPTQRRVSKPLTPIAEEGADVGRLLAETDHQLNDNESVRRRRVISQMRAAVAATKADRLVSRRVVSREVEAEAAERERYRDDLSEAVRDVSRPLSGKEPSRKPSVAPLVLVSSQRVDAPSAPTQEQAEPVAEDFAGFAKSMGARDLPELLEAAAAYTAFVEGQPSFSRPEIMKRVARVDPSLRMSREDGLRSFGQLLRQGTFRKLERGQFTISDKTRFKPEQRYVGE